MTRLGVILYGPPTSGKDTVTAELTRQDPRYTLLRKLKAGTGRAEGYRASTDAELDALHAAGRLVAQTRRYGNRYAVDRRDVEELAASGRVPVVHMGNLADLDELRTAVPLEWTTVLLWIPREECERRSTRRGDADSAARVKAWDETEADLRDAPDPSPFVLVVHTDQTTAAETARRIREATATATGTDR